MPLILHIETSTDICSVALSKGKDIIGFISVNEKNAHSAQLTSFIENLFNNNNLKIVQLNAVCVSKGPGSFTGLRIGVAVAKGICFGAHKPLISVNTLQSLASPLSKDLSKNELICSMIDARNNEVYYAIYDQNYNEVLETTAGLIDEKQIISIINGKQLYLVGDGIKYWKFDLSDKMNFILRNDVLPDARNLIPIALQKYNSGDFEDIVNFEPFYLRDFKARKLSMKINKVLGLPLK
jgi:tRNA threonylcarbamoyladenosine biosynthesis protein TsaB